MSGSPANTHDKPAGFNLSKWALDHAPLTRYLMVVLMVLGAFAYFQLGQDEDRRSPSAPWSSRPTGRAPPRSRWPNK